MTRAPAAITGLQNLEGGSDLLRVYHVYLVQDVGLTVAKCVDNHAHGSFCTPILRNAMEDRAPVSLS
jgi:hypothetical protein